MCGWEGVFKNKNLLFQLDELIEVVINRFYYKIRSFKSIYVADFDFVYVFFDYELSFCLNDWIENVQIFLK